MENEAQDIVNYISFHFNISCILIWKMSCLLEIALCCVRIEQTIRNQTLRHQGGKKSVDNTVNQPGDKCLPGWSPTISQH